MITPKEKADILYWKFYDSCGTLMEEDSIHDYAIQTASMVIDEVLAQYEQMSDEASMIFIEGILVNPLTMINYWQNVQRELISPTKK
jgi:hypothetical protein